MYREMGIMTSDYFRVSPLLSEQPNFKFTALSSTATAAAAAASSNRIQSQPIPHRKEFYIGREGRLDRFNSDIRCNLFGFKNQHHSNSELSYFSTIHPKISLFMIELPNCQSCFPKLKISPISVEAKDNSNNN